MIVIFTSNSKGGILQFSLLLAYEYSKMGYNTVLFCPNESVVNDVNINIEFYERQKTLNRHNKKILSVTKRILNYNPSLVIFLDDVITSAEIAINISTKVKTAMIVHDVTQHATKSMYRKIRRIVNMGVIKKSYTRVDNVICLSKTSLDKMKILFPCVLNKLIYLPLGAHLVTENMSQPQEVSVNDYVLFFGRIDKYKGIENLIDSYVCSSKKMPLIIAGNGKIETSYLCKAENNGVTVVNRYISDEEMNWLFYNSKVVVLPYIEASQSGIIPISYHFGKPVVVTNLPGLVENVINHSTGEIVYDSQKLMDSIETVFDNSNLYGVNAKKYCDEVFNWEHNLHDLYARVMGK